MTIVHPLYHIFWYARQDSNPPEQISAGPQPAVNGFEVQEFWSSKWLWFQLIESIQLFKLTFGFVWNCLEIFDLDGHILSTVLFPLNSYLQPSFSSGSLKIGKKNYSILNSWKLSGTSVISAALVFGGRMWPMSFIVIWIVGIYNLGLRALNVKSDECWGPAFILWE